jgi:predicted flavoprotein YhiN
MEIARDALVATSVGICGEKIYQKVKNWYYHKEDIDIKDIHIEFTPQTTEDEIVIIIVASNLN